MIFLENLSHKKQAPMPSADWSGPRPGIKALANLLMLGVALSTTATAQAYFITPFAQLNGDSSNGFVENGPTSGSASIGTAVIAEVDLATGEARNYVQVGTGQSAGVMGDRFTLTGGPSAVEFIFNFAGLAGALVSDTRSLNFDNPSAALHAMVDKALSGSLDFLGGNRTRHQLRVRCIPRQCATGSRSARTVGLRLALSWPDRASV